MVHRLYQEQRLSITLDDAWAFFSDPSNLRHITPPDLGFETVSPLPPEVYAGLFIVHRVRPLFHIPVTWVTEITHVERPHRFVDEQRVGPYRIWHHEHTFRAIEGGVVTEDLVHYELPFGPLGVILERFLVRPRLREIFTYRRGVLEQCFGTLL